MSEPHADIYSQPHDAQRVDLASVFRLCARLGMHEAIANHFSVTLDDSGRHFLINPGSRHFANLKASDLLVIDSSHPTGGPQGAAVHPTAWSLHGAIHRVFPSIRCVLHVHSRYATALSCLVDNELPPIDQNCMRFFGRVAYDTGYDGMGLESEAERVVRSADSTKPILMLANHGVMAFGASIAEAFDTLYYFERACRTYITALSTGRPLRIGPAAVAEKTALQWESFAYMAKDHLKQQQQILDREEPDYAR